MKPIELLRKMLSGKLSKNVQARYDEYARTII